MAQASNVGLHHVGAYWSAAKNPITSNKLAAPNRAQHDIFHLEGWNQPILGTFASTHFAVGSKFLRISALNGKN
jgi:hypothetical protein